MAACGGEKKIDTAELIDKKPELRYFATTNTRNLRLRSTPDLQGEVVEIVPMEGALVEYLQDSTTFETQVGQGQSAMVARWYKIRTEKGNEGWAFGALLRFKTLNENKAITAQQKALALQYAQDSSQKAAILSAAGSNKRALDNKVNEPLVSQYGAYVQRLSERSIWHVSMAADELQRLCADASSATADRAYIQFRAFYQRAENEVRKQHNPSRWAGKAAELRQYGRAYTGNDSILLTLERNGFRLSIVEGKVDWVQDVDFLARQFYRLVSPNMRAYLNQMQLESEVYWQENQRLLVPAAKIAEWAAFWSNFADRNTEFLLAPEARQRSRQLLTMLIYGLQNSPAFDAQKRLSEDYKSAYEYIIEHSPNSDIGERFIEYYSLLKDNDFKRTSAVEQAQLEFFE